MVDILYYRNIIGTQNDPEILKLEMHDLLNELEEERKESFPLGAEVKVNFADDLQNVINVLDAVIGDTDPEELDPDFTEDELIDEFPIIYCFQKLQEIKSKISA